MTDIDRIAFACSKLSIATLLRLRSIISRQVNETADVVRRQIEEDRDRRRTEAA